MNRPPLIAYHAPGHGLDVLDRGAAEDAGGGSDAREIAPGRGAQALAESGAALAAAAAHVSAG
ncbi:hypothetical protein [Methylobacterium sp. E-066]|uniref:hypothetical protein n=1 Tax=Methylobacterium sp. E-066 TaxID=2836584 RepID=UPI001FBABEBA|nr:hypothetical protein [Methylobacterium sp. E-066]MCJ2143723.1 hypothetical protein [Methylobacterium sp. E-066]